MSGCSVSPKHLCFLDALRKEVIKMDVNRKRNKTLTVRLTEDEKNAIAEKANQAHMTHTKSTLTMQPAQKALDMVTGRCYNDHHRINRLLTQKGK